MDNNGCTLRRAEIVICQGLPRCSLVGDEADAAQVAGCVWCERIIIGPDGSETIIAPGNA